MPNCLLPIQDHGSCEPPARQLCISCTSDQALAHTCINTSCAKGQHVRGADWRASSLEKTRSSLKR